MPLPTLSFFVRSTSAARKLIVDRVFDDHAAGRGAFLAGGEERGVDDVFDGSFEVRRRPARWSDSCRPFRAGCAGGAWTLRRAASSPTSQEPVNETAFSPGALMSALPSVPPDPATKFTTPFGIPASWHASTIRQALSGETDAGLTTIVLPQISAGAIFQAGIAMGKFQGVTRPTTPMGLRCAHMWTRSRSEATTRAGHDASLRRRSSGRC